MILITGPVPTLYDVSRAAKLSREQTKEIQRIAKTYPCSLKDALNVFLVVRADKETFKRLKPILEWFK